MAEGNVSVRFSVQDAETVRSALEKLGTDGQKALQKLNASGQTPGAGMKAVSDVVDSLKSRLTGLAFSIGPVGSGLVQLGPVGIAAAGAIGAVVSTLDKVSDGAKNFGVLAASIKDMAEQSRLSTTELQAVLDLMARHGVDAETASAGINKFAGQLAAARRGSGELYDELKRLSPALAEQFASASTTAGALSVLAAAESKADGATQSLLNRLAFGKAGAGFSGAMADIAGAGGIGAIDAAAKRAGTSIDNDIIQKQANAAVEAQRRSKLVEQNWNAAFSAIYDKWKDFKSLIGLGPNNEIAISVAVRAAAESFQTLSKRPQGSITEELNSIQKQKDELIDALNSKPQNLLGSFATRGWQQSQRDIQKKIADLDKQENELRAEVDRRTENQRESQRATSNSPIDGSFKDNQASRDAFQRQVNDERARLGVLAETASSTERVKAKNDELVLSQQNGANVTSAEIALETRAFDVRQRGADLQIKLTNDVATATDLYAQRQNELNVLVATGKLTQDQANQSLQTYASKIIPETIKQQEARRAALTNLKQLEQTAGDLRGNLDSVATESAKNIGDAFTDMATGAKTGADAVKNLETQVIRSLTNMVMQMMVVAPIAKALQGLLGGFLPGGGMPLSLGSGSSVGSIGGTGLGGFGGLYANGGVFSKFANGGTFSNGIFSSPTFFRFANGGTPGLGVMGEAGPEAVMPLVRGRGGQLGVRSNGGGNGSDAPVNVTIVGAPADKKSDVSARRGSDGTLDLLIAFKDQVAADISSGGSIAKSIEGQYGLNRVTSAY